MSSSPTNNNNNNNETNHQSTDDVVVVAKSNDDKIAKSNDDDKINSLIIEIGDSKSSLLSNWISSFKNHKFILVILVGVFYVNSVGLMSSSNNGTTRKENITHSQHPAPDVDVEQSLLVAHRDIDDKCFYFHGCSDSIFNPGNHDFDCLMDHKTLDGRKGYRTILSIHMKTKFLQRQTQQICAYEGADVGTFLFADKYVPTRNGGDCHSAHCVSNRQDLIVDTITCSMNGETFMSLQCNFEKNNTLDFQGCRVCKV